MFSVNGFPFLFYFLTLLFHQNKLFNNVNISEDEYFFKLDNLLIIKFNEFPQTLSEFIALYRVIYVFLKSEFSIDYAKNKRIIISECFVQLYLLFYCVLVNTKNK